MSTPNQTTRPAWRGSLILLGLVVAAILVFNLQAIIDLMRPQLDVVALVTDAPGVRVGTEVWAEGVKIGRVKDVVITKRQDRAYVSMDLRLDPRAVAIVTAESDVLASRQRFIGDPIIRIFAGAPGDPPLRPGDTIVGKPRPTPQELLDQAMTFPATLDSLMEAARLVQARFEARKPRMEQMGDELRSVADAASALASELETGSIGRMLDDRAGLRARIRALRLRVSDLGEASRHMAERYSLDTDDGLAAHLDRLNRRARDVEAALARLQARMEEGEGFVARVQADTALQVAVRGIQLQLDSLMAEAHSIALRMFLP